MMSPASLERRGWEQPHELALEACGTHTAVVADGGAKALAILDISLFFFSIGLKALLQEQSSAVRKMVYLCFFFSSYFWISYRPDRLWGLRKT